MSDTGRESITDKVGAAVKPNSEKSTTEHLSDSVKGKADNVAGSAQPESEKSYVQQASDAVSGNQASGDSLMTKAKEALGVAAPGGAGQSHD
ncbi:hypothetical protein FRB94_005855 [Tulasnella sp. JGI-2019a]|nr:hypothetical protein FRB93_011472 [Tulasnella sp. JGI-2019a]KAG9012538.1 hypothetical protein FRB94_005855 [Tulasnella sp. JGI-2019a]KAG9036577.1 hypothetical protein FRB95_008411 [Tulasnella sp. JGI-2019a]